MDEEMLVQGMEEDEAGLLHGGLVGAVDYVPAQVLGEFGRENLTCCVA